MLKIIAYYIRILFIPYGLNADYVFAPANTFFELPVVAGLILTIFFFALAVRCAKKNAIVTFAIFWFFVSYFPVSNIIPSGNIFAERYLYIPSLGFCVAVCFGFMKLSQMSVKTERINWQKCVIIFFTLIIILFGRTTFERNKVWYNEFTLWYETHIASPKSGRAHLNLGNVYASAGFTDKAIEEFNSLLQSQADPRWYAYLFNNSAMIYLNKGLNDEAIKAFNVAANFNPEAAMISNNLATCYGRKGNFKKSVEMAQAALKKNPYFYLAHYNLALGFTSLGRNKEAIKEYEKYLEVIPYDVGVRIALGHLYFKAREKVKARQEWEFALKLSKDNPEARAALKLLDKK